MNKTESISAVCPFYRKNDAHRICCEGTHKCNRIHLVFYDSNIRKTYKEMFCDDIEKHHECMICKMLEGKYEA